LIKAGRDHQTPVWIVEAVVAVSGQRKRAMARKVAAALGGNLCVAASWACSGTFTPNTDDMREAPSIATALQDMGATVRAYDPAGMEQAKPRLPEIAYADRAYACRKVPTRSSSSPSGSNSARWIWRGSRRP
jgi:UDPglucose 6-dehydrogenase